MLTFRAKLFSFEQEILRSVGEALEPSTRNRYEAQIACINKVQRLLEWKEIEFYCMRFFKVRWPHDVLFEDMREFILATGTLHARGLSAEFTVWSVNGHLFSIESPTPLKPFRSARYEEIEPSVIHSKTQTRTQHR